MKEQTTCSASYLNISLMFIRYTEKLFFILFFLIFANVYSSQFCPVLNMKCQTTTRKCRHCSIFPAQPATESLMRQLADFQFELVEPRCLHNLYRVGLYVCEMISYNNNNQIFKVAQHMQHLGLQTLTES